MHIKRVTINGFTSYEQLTMESGKQLSKGCNLILGLNGCGKSNFLQAIIFALSDHFKSKSKQDKRKLLHEGLSRVRNSAGNDTSAFSVEVALDNTERRIPVEADELVVRKSYNA